MPVNGEPRTSNASSAFRLKTEIKRLINGYKVLCGLRDAFFVGRLYGSACKQIVPFNGSNSGSL